MEAESSAPALLLQTVSCNLPLSLTLHLRRNIMRHEICLLSFKPFLYWQRLPFSRCLLHSSNCGNCLKVRGIRNASRLHRLHTNHIGHAGQSFSPPHPPHKGITDSHQPCYWSVQVPPRKVNICILLNMHAPISILVRPGNGLFDISTCMIILFAFMRYCL